MSLRASRARLAAGTKQLLLKWDDTRSSWRDARGDEFERKYLAELEAGVEKALLVIEQLDEILAKLRSECE
jgi:hypothetical protein